MLEHLILGMLTIKPMTGYEIKKAMQNSTAFFSNVSDGSLYPALNRCEASGLVVARELVENGRFKKIYEITHEGNEVFSLWLKAPLKPFIFKYEMLIRLFFAHNLAPDELREIISQHIEQLQELNSSLQAIEKKQAKKVDNFQLTTLHFGQDFYQFLINWYEKLEQDLYPDEKGSGLAKADQATKDKDK